MANLGNLNARIQRQQAMQIVLITFWSQFASFAFNTILILFLIKPIALHGLGYSQAKAYGFIGVFNATAYLLPIFGGAMADHILGLRRSILFGGFLLVFAYYFLIHFVLYCFFLIIPWPKRVTATSLLRLH